MSRRGSLLTVVLLVAGSAIIHFEDSLGCTTILAGKAATADGSVLMATSCDGNIMGRVYVLPAKTYPPGTKVEMLFDFPAPSTWPAYREQVQSGYTVVGRLPLERTYRCVLAAGHLADSITGGINEHGLSMGIEYMGMKPELVNERGNVSTCSNHWTTSLIANGLMRAKTAREAIQLMGALVEKHGFTYYWAPSAGCAVPVVDGKEAWIMEVFGPGRDWTPESGRPGAVWCAQRVPDDEVTCNANRSRIAEVDPDDHDRFMMSPNVFSLAENLGLWQPEKTFVWHEVYGVPGNRGNSLREWGALNSLAPSLGLEATGDPHQDRYPFSVKPDSNVNVQDLTSVMRDYYEGTEFDITLRPPFCDGIRKSPFARPFGSTEFFNLLGVQRERCIGSETSGYVYVSQIRDGLPAPVSGCMWFTLGPSYTSCFAPIYSGTTEIAEPWSRLPDFTKIDRSQIQWKFQLVEDLTGLKYQEAIQDVRGVFEPAEETFRELQPVLEETAVKLFRAQGASAAERFVTQYSNSCMDNVDRVYGKLADYLLFKYLYSYSDAAPPTLPKMDVPEIPKMPLH